MKVKDLVKLLSGYNENCIIQLDFDTTNLNLRSTDYHGEYSNYNTLLGTIQLPTEYEYKQEPGADPGGN